MRQKKIVDNNKLPYHRTLSGVIGSLYNGMKQRSKGKTFDISPTEFREFAGKSKALKTLYFDWVISGFDTSFSPSVDRFNNDEGYTMKNIRFITKYENTVKGNKPYVLNVVHLLEKRNELVWALSLQGYTQAQIARMFNCNRSTMKRVIDQCPKDWKPKWQKVQE